MKSIYRTLGWVVVIVLALAVSASAKPGYGTLSGVVLDPSGMPQMGATVWLISEDAGGRIDLTITLQRSTAHFPQITSSRAIMRCAYRWPDFCRPWSGTSP